MGTEKSCDLNAVPTVPTKNDKGPSAAKISAGPEPDDVGLSRSAIRDLARWYDEEADRRRDGIRLDQDALDRDLRPKLVERGVFAEFVSIEFERVMQAVFCVPPRWRQIVPTATPGASDSAKQAPETPTKAAEWPPRPVGTRSAAP